MAREPATAPEIPSTSPPAAISYNAWVQRRPDLARRSHERLLEVARADDLMVHGRPLCNVLRPRFLTRDSFHRLAQDSAILVAVFQRAGEHMLRSPHLLDRLDASDQERDLWEVDPGYHDLTATSRLDTFLVDDAPRIVEYNAESPAGIGYSDVLTDAFTTLPLLMDWPDRPSLRPFHARRQLWRTLVDLFHEWGGHGVPSIAVVDWQTVLTRRDFELCAEFFRRQGASCVVVDPRDLEYRSGRLRHHGDVVDLVYRRVLLHELLEHAGAAHDLLQAYRDGAVCMVNSPRSKLLHKKSVMALLSGGTLDLGLDRREQEVIARTVPWTRLLRDGATTYRERTVDLLQFARDNKEVLTLKPSDDYGGRGVVLGWNTDQTEWERSLERALGTAYVLQERVAVPEAYFPVWDGDLELVPLLIDTDPLLFRGEIGGILTRTSSDPVLNVTAGSGSTTPTFVVETD